jgi:hypothetical protein
MEMLGDRPRFSNSQVWTLSANAPFSEIGATRAPVILGDEEKRGLSPIFFGVPG